MDSSQNCVASIFHKNDMIKKNWRCLPFFLNLNLTRMHSSRMRTARALTVSPSMFCSGGRGVSAHGGVSADGVSAPGGCLLRGVSAPGGSLLLGGCLLPGGVCSGVSALGGVCSQGVSAPRGMSAPKGGVCSLGGVFQHALRQTPPL